MADKILNMSIPIENLHQFISYIKELSLIDPTIIISISENDFILYSFVGNNINDIHAFKTVISNINDIFNKDNDIENKIIFIIKNGKTFVRNLSNFMDYNEEIKIKISYDINDLNANYLQMNNSKLKIREISGDPILMSKEITKKDIDFLINKNNSLFDFTISELDFRKIKRMSATSTTDILSIIINNNSLSIGDNKWELKICDIDKPNINVSFPKKYFNKLTFKDNSKLYLFENYILISDDNSDLMIVLETSV